MTAQQGVAGSIDTKSTPRHDGGGEVRVSLRDRGWNLM